MKYCLLFLLIFTGNALLAQDSSFVQRMQKFGRDQALKNMEVYRQEKISIHQREVIENSKRLNQTIKIFLKEVIDTDDIEKLVDHTRADIGLAEDGIVVNQGSYQTQRNLVVSTAILEALAKRLDRQKRRLDKYVGDLLDYKIKVDSLHGDSIIYTLSPDSAEIVNYLRKIQLVVNEFAPVDSSLNKALTTTQALQLKLDLTLFEIRSFQEDLEIIASTVTNRNKNKEFPYLWEDAAFFRPYDAVLQVSAQKEFTLLRYYIRDNSLSFFFLLAVLFSSFLFLRALKRQVRLNSPQDPESTGPGHEPTGRFVIQSPVVSATLLALCIIQFIFPDPPFVLYFIFWLISGICLMSIVLRYLPAYWKLFWVVIGLLFILSGIDNLVLQASRAERWYTACLAFAGLIFTGTAHFGKHKRGLKEKSVIYFINFVFICELISLILNITGRFNLSKTFLVSGYSGVIIAILFLWVVRLVNEGLTLAQVVYKRPNRRLFFINFDRVGDEVHPAFYVVLVMGWFFLVGQNFYAFKRMYDGLVDILTQQRSVGDYKFSIMGMLGFFLILISSMLLSRLVSIFASEPEAGQKGQEGKRFKLGSYILLIRIFIICLGLFIAFAAAGISLDKITILFGALGVGIGLGLQGLVTNLVSGLILSFERPINVGDLIEFNGKTGTMQSIGFRSSIIAGTDGSRIIIPNGELLSRQMVNWTMGHNLQQNTLILGVAFGSDLEKVKTSIIQIIDEDDRILHYPPAEVLIDDFSKGAINIKVVFWPKHISLGKKVKSDLIVKIDTVFKQQDIVISMP